MKHLFIKTLKALVFLVVYVMLSSAVLAKTHEIYQQKKQLKEIDHLIADMRQLKDKMED